MNPTVADIQALPDGFPVVDLKVRVEKVGKPFENEGQQGKWFRQSVLVSDPTGQIEVSRSWDAKDDDPYMLTPGMMVLVSARPSNKGGQLVGVQKTTYREKPQIRARAGFVTPIQGQTPSEGGSGVSGQPVASGGHPMAVAPVPTTKSLFRQSGPTMGAMTEEEACQIIARNYVRLADSFEGYHHSISPAELSSMSISVFIAVGRGDVVRDSPITMIAPAYEQPDRTSAELERRLTRKSAEEIVLEKARAGGYDETEPGDDPAWEYGR